MTPNTVEPPVVQKTELRTKKKRSVWPWILVLAVAGAATYLYPRVTQFGPQQPTKKGGKGGEAGRAIPVVAALARRGDMPVYLTGLGSVAAFNTVTVRTRVDGQIIKVYFQEGQMVKEGDPLIEIDPKPFQVQLEMAEGQLARDQALLDNAKIDLQRYKILFSQEAIPKQQLDTQTAMVSQSQATIKSDQAQIDTAKLQLFYAHITAPISGRIGLRLVDGGNMVHATDATGLAVITQLQPIAVIFNIEQDHLPAVIKKMAAGDTLPVIAYAKDSTTKIATGTLATIDNQIDQTTGTVRFKAVFENKDLSLFPNQFVNANLLLDTRHGATIIPTAAIQRSPQSTFVYVVNPDNTVEVRDITVGTTLGDEAVIDKGVDAGDKVVIDGIDKLQDKTKVNVRMAGSAPKAG